MLQKQINLLKPYQLEEGIFNKFNKYEEKLPEEKIEKQEKNIKHQNKYFITNEKDKLFWYFFIIKYGFLEYELLNNNTFIKEREEKIKLIEEIRKNKSIIKNQKWKINILESELVDNKPISLNTFLCCCFINNINIIVKKNNCLYHQKFNNEDIEEIVELTNDGYSLNLNKDENKELVTELLENNYIITNINKPIKAISNYKLKELHEISSKMKIDIKDKTGKKYKKVQLYDIIKTHI